VPAHLEPSVEPPVVMQENAPRRGMDDEAAARDVSGRERLPRETAGLRLDEREDGRAVSRLAVVGRGVAEKGGPEGGAGGIEPGGRFHGRTLAGGAGSGIIREMAPPFDRPLLAVFCGARAGVSTAYADEAAAVGREIVRAGAGLVFGGGRVGLMGVLADAVLEEGGIAYGVIPAGLFAKEVAHGGLTRLEVVNTMHERKALMADMADGFLALPGGYGTLDEFFEIVTWRQLGHHARPIVLYNRSGFFDPLLAATRRIADEGFAREGADYFAVETDPAAAVRRALAGASRPAPPAHGGEDRR
jgi:uncharacterized protein (TIGR00730 family)